MFNYKPIKNNNQKNNKNQYKLLNKYKLNKIV